MKQTTMKKRTSCEVRRWLWRQPWFRMFNGFAWRNNSLKNYLRLILGLSGERTVRDAFYWADTVQGFRYWNKADIDFGNWYHGV